MVQFFILQVLYGVDKSTLELCLFLTPIYIKYNRPQPTVYLEKTNIAEVKTWDEEPQVKQMISSSMLVWILMFGAFHS